MAYGDKFIPLEICRQCPHFEKLKNAESTDEFDKKVMCRYFIDEKTGPFNARWAGVYKDGNTMIVECVKINHEQGGR